MTTSYTSVFGGQVVNPSQVSYNAISLTTNITLSWAVDGQVTNGSSTNPVVAYNMKISPTTGGLSVTLPDATLTSTGQAFIINNPTGTNFTLKKNDGSTLTTIAGPSVNYFVLTNTTTPAGLWDFYPFGSGYSAVTSVNAAVPASPDSSNLVITGGPITVSGTLDFAFAADLEALISFNTSTGIAARTASNTWALRNIIGTTNQINVANQNGVSGNPTISLNSTITGINSLTVGNLQISGNTITSVNSNGAVILQSLGSGNIVLDPTGTGIIEAEANIVLLTGFQTVYNTSGVGSGFFALGAGAMGNTQVTLTWPTASPTTGQVMQFAGSGQLQWATLPTTPGTTTVNTVPKFINTGGSLGESGMTIDNSNNVTGVNSLLAGNIQLGAISANTISTTGADEPLILQPNGTGPTQCATTLEVHTGNELRFFNAANSNYNWLVVNSALAANVGWQLPSVDGGSDCLMQTDGSGRLSFSQLTGDAANKAGMISATSTTNPVIPANLIFADTSVKASLNYSNSGTLTINDSFGINTGSTTRTGTGVVQVTLSTAMANSTYYVTATINDGSKGIPTTTISSSTVFTVNTYNLSGSATDMGVSLNICGRQ